MKRLFGALVLAALVLAGCSSSGGGGAPKSTPPTVTSSSAVAPAPTTDTPTPTETDPIAAQINADEYPPCKLVVGEPTSLVIRGTIEGSVDLRCFTGKSLAADNTSASSMDSDANDTKGKGPIYYWASSNPNNADQHVYAAKKGGVVLIVPDAKAKYFFTIGGGLAAVMLAVGL
jgi:ABC-type phosphate/phosphonate transport system substrate-binding protein